MKENKYYQRWKAYRKNWKLYDLSHLHQFSFFKKIWNNTVRIVVSFSDHCFTEKNINNSSENLYLHSYPEPRIFSEERYNLSLNLREIILNKFFWAVYFSQKNDYFKIELWNWLKYFIYFDIKKRTSKSMEILVNSAYIRNNNPELWSNKINFDTLLQIIYKNKKPKRI